MICLRFQRLMDISRWAQVTPGTVANRRSHTRLTDPARISPAAGAR